MQLWGCADELVLIEAFRQGAKTTLAEEHLCMQAAYGNFRYTVIFGETYAKACQKIEAIAYEARTNHKIRKLFGNILAKKPIENKIWFTQGCLIEAAGWEQEITGFKYLDHRPDQAYLDDVESIERVRSTEAVDATMNKLYREIMPAMDSSRRRIRVTETPRAADCLVTRLRALPDWLCASFPICNGDPDDPATVAAWPGRYPMEWIRSERDKFSRAGMLRQFEQEYMLNVETSDTKPFNESMLRAVDMAPAAWLPRYAIFDPSRTANPGTSARTGKVVVSRLGSKIIVHESEGQFWQPDEIREAVFKTAARHRCSKVGIEKNSLDDFLLQPLRYEMLRRGVMLPLEPLSAPQDRDKEAFIMGLQPFFAAGDIILVGGRGMHPQLVAEVLNFPGGANDTLNALAYAIRMFAGSPVYEDFGEENVAPAPEPRAQEPLYCGWNARSAETFCVVFQRNSRHFSVLRDMAVPGSITDAVRTVLHDLRSRYPRASLEHYVSPELHDAATRIALVPALRAERARVWRGEHVALARGGLVDLIRTSVRQVRLLTVSKDAPMTLAALAGDYKYPLGAGGNSPEPAPGLARLAAEALESSLVFLEKGVDTGEEKDGHFATNATGARFRTAMPTNRRP